MGLSIVKRLIDTVLSRTDCEKLIKYQSNSFELKGIDIDHPNLRLSFDGFKIGLQPIIEQANEAARILDDFQYQLCKDLSNKSFKTLVDRDTLSKYVKSKFCCSALYLYFRTVLLAFNTNPDEQNKAKISDAIHQIKSFVETLTRDFDKDERLSSDGTNAISTAVQVVLKSVNLDSTEDEINAKLLTRSTSLETHYKTLIKKIEDFEQAFNKKLSETLLSGAGLRLVTPLTDFKKGNSNCWKEGYFTEEDIKSNYDVKRSVIDAIQETIKNKKDNKIGTLIIGDGYFGKTVLLKRIMFEMIKDNYCVIFGENIKAQKHQIESVLNGIAANYEKILVIIDDVHKEYNEVIFSVSNSNLNTNISFLFSCRDRELNRQKPDIFRALKYLDNIYLKFQVEDAQAYIQKAANIFDLPLDTNHIYTQGKVLYDMSNGDPFIFNCFVRSIISNKSEMIPAHLEISINAMRNCVCDEIKKQIKILEDQKHLWKPFVLLSILGMFRIPVTSNSTIVECLEIPVYHLEYLVEHGLIRKEKEYFFTVHEIMSEEFLIFVFHAMYANNANSFNSEREIFKILSCIYKNLSKDEIISIFRKCTLNYSNQRTLPLSTLLAENYSIKSKEKSIREDLSKFDEADIYCYGLAHYYSGIHSLPKAIEFYDTAITIDPDNISYHSQKALALDNNGKHSEALVLYNRCLADNPSDPVLWYNTGVTLLNLEKYEDSIKAFDNAMKLDPQNTDAINNKGRALVMMGKLEDASDEFERTLKMDHYYYYALNNKAWLLTIKGRTDEALLCIDKSLEINPNEGKTWFIKYMILNEEERYEEALFAITKTTNKSPNIPEYWYKKGQILHVLGRYLEAVDAYDQAIRLNPKFYEAISDKGNSVLSQGRINEAIEMFNEAIEINPNDPIMWYNKGYAFYNLQNYSEAIKSAKKATDLAFNYVSAWTLQMMCYIMMGDKIRASLASAELSKIEKNKTFESHAVDRHGQIGQIFSSRL